MVYRPSQFLDKIKVVLISICWCMHPDNWGGAEADLRCSFVPRWLEFC